MSQSEKTKDELMRALTEKLKNYDNHVMVFAKWLQAKSSMNGWYSEQKQQKTESLKSKHLIAYKKERNLIAEVELSPDQDLEIEDLALTEA